MFEHLLHWHDITIIVGTAIAIVLFLDNIIRHIRQYRGCGLGMRIFIIYIETIKLVGGTFLTLLWIATSLFLYEGIIEYFGGKGLIVSIALILPICVVFYLLLQGFTRMMDAFPHLLHQNNSDEDHD